MLSSAAGNVRVHTKRLAITSQTHFSQSLFSECARGVLLRISKTRNRSSQFFSLRAGRSKKPFPDGTHIQSNQGWIKGPPRERCCCVCRRAARGASLARVWLMAASRAICLVSAAGARAVPTAGVKLITFHSQSVQNYRLHARAECDLDTWCGPSTALRCTMRDWAPVFLIHLRVTLPSGGQGHAEFAKTCTIPLKDETESREVESLK